MARYNLNTTKYIFIKKKSKTKKHIKGLNVIKNLFHFVRSPPFVLPTFF